MDTLTHALSGALVARATEPAHPRPDQLPRRTRMWIGFWAAAFPDSDFVVRFIDPLLYLTTHRGITHSVVMLPIWAAVLALAFMWILRRRYPWRALVGITALGIGAHILGDVITAFGTMVLAPLTDWRLQLPTTFIIDPYFTSILIAGLIASAVWTDTRRPAIVALSVLAGLIAFQGIQHQRAIAIGEHYAQSQHLGEVSVYAVPQPFSPFNWMIVLRDKDRYRLAYVDLVASKPPAPPSADAMWLRKVAAAYWPADALQWKDIPRFGTTPMESELASEVWHAESFARFRRFALFPAVYRVDRGPERTCVWFNDLRFSLFGRDMPFRYGACRGSTAGSSWQMYRLLGNGANEALDIVRRL